MTNCSGFKLCSTCCTLSILSKAKNLSYILDTLPIRLSMTNCSGFIAMQHLMYIVNYEQSEESKFLSWNNKKGRKLINSCQIINI